MYREDLVKLFQEWSACHPEATILFKGCCEGLPEKIHLFNYVSKYDAFAIQNDYVEYLRKTLGEHSVYGDCSLYAVDIFLFDTRNYSIANLIIKGGELTTYSVVTHSEDV